MKTGLVEGTDLRIHQVSHVHLNIISITTIRDRIKLVLKWIVW